MKHVLLALTLLATTAAFSTDTTKTTYPGTKHTTSHGGTYTGSTGGSSHKNGHYENSKTGDKYGTHKK